MIEQSILPTVCVKGATILVTGHNFYIKANYVVSCPQYPCLWWCKMLHHYVNWCESCPVSRSMTRRSSLPPSITFNYRCLINKLLISNFSKNICDAVIVMSTLFSCVQYNRVPVTLLFILQDSITNSHGKTGYLNHDDRWGEPATICH